MQFHLDGFRPGDPTIADAEAALPPDVPIRTLPGEVDVLVVGSGPTGLTLAAQLAAFPDISVCVAEMKPGPLRLGQADGIACRTIDRIDGALVVVRPDQHVAHVLPLDGHAALSSFFDAFMIAAG